MNVERKGDTYYVAFPTADRALLEECERHLARLVDRYAQINAGDRMLLKRLRAHLSRSD